MIEALFGGENIHTVLRFSLFMLSQWGWWCLLGKHSRANLYFLPSLAACFQITALVCMGIAKQLLPGAYLLLALGVVFFLYSLLRKQNPLQYISFLEVAFLLCMMVLVFCATKGKVVFQHDDFSHWGTVLKELFRTDRISNGSPYLTEHLTYPLGSVLWIYSFSRIICVDSETAWMFAQALLMLYCILPLFCFLPKQSGGIYICLYLVFVVILTNCFLYYDIKIFNLLVDTELPLVGAAATLFAFYAYDQPPHSLEKRPRQYALNGWFLVPYLCAIMQIKPSGFFFAFSAIAVLFLKTPTWSKKRKLIQTGGIFAVSLVPLILWRSYCSKFYSGLAIKHEGSLSSFLRIFSQKSPDDISSIFHNSVTYFLTSRYFIEFIIVFAVIFVVAILISDDSDFFQTAKVWGFLLLAYLVFTFSTIAMFVFSMPRNEALKLSSIDRYQKTILIYCYFFLACTLLFSLSNINFVILRSGRKIASSQKSPQKHSIRDICRYVVEHTNDQNQTVPRIQAARILVLLCVTALLCTGWSYRNNGHFYTIFDGYSATYLYPRLNCEAALKEAGVPQRAKCVVLTTEDKRVYKALLAFLLGTDRNDIKQITITSFDQLAEVDDALAGEYWVLVVDQENEMIQTWLSQQENPHIVIIPYDTR